MTFPTPHSLRRSVALALCLLGLSTPAVLAAETMPHGFLETVRRHTVLTQTVPPNGDQNPYALVVAPVSVGKIRKNDVLITNFNNSGNLQGLGSTIVDYDPATRQMSLFASIPRHLPGCPGGIGLTTAMTMLQSGWIIVGSLPSQDGTTTTKGDGCLMVLDPQGKVAGAFTGPNINGPWGNMAVVDRGTSASLFVSNTGFGVTAPGQPVIRKATVLRLELAISGGQIPRITSQTVIGDGFGEQADKDVFIVGPTGLALGPNGTLYVSDAIGNSIGAIDNALTRTDSAGTGRVITKDGFLKRPLALTLAPNGHLIAVNGLNGQAVEIDPADGHQLYAQWIDPNKAQSPAGSGDLFGIAMTPAGNGFYYVEDEINSLVLAH